VLRAIVGHPFWAGLRDGSLPGAALAHFVRQDTGHLLPALGRAFAGCAAVADEDAHAARLGLCAHATIESAPRLLAEFTALAPSLGIEPPDGPVPADAATRAYCSFLRAAPATSFVAGIGAVLPMMWFHMVVCQDLSARSLPGSRYLPWLEVYNPGERAWPTTRDFLGMVDEIGRRSGPAGRDQLVAHFTVAGDYELAFAEAGFAAALAGSDRLPA
jgi:thiaminase/transcriptional activator TenA